MRPDKFILRWAKKYRAIENLGGKCVKCGESRIFALDFHHTNPNEKEFGLGSIMRHKTWKAIESELKKCIILCRNCHSIHHAESSGLALKYQKSISEIVEKAKEVDDIERPKLDDDHIFQLLLKNFNLTQIAKTLGTRPSSIFPIAKKLEEKHGKKLFLSQEERNKKSQKIDKEILLLLLEKNYTVQEMATYFGSAKSTIYGLLRKLRKPETK